MLSPTDAGVVKYRKLLAAKHFQGRDAALAEEQSMDRGRKAEAPDTQSVPD